MSIYLVGELDNIDNILFGENLSSWVAGVNYNNGPKIYLLKQQLSKKERKEIESLSQTQIF